MGVAAALDPPLQTFYCQLINKMNIKVKAKQNSKGLFNGLSIWRGAGEGAGRWGGAEGLVFTV